MPFTATRMDLEIIISEVSKKAKDEYHIALICEIYNMTQKNLPTTQKQTHRHREETCG